MFTRDSIDRLRDAIDMVDLVSTKTDLRRVGTRHTGLCPFHDERTPSFSVNAEEKLFYCFGCQAKGDAIGFVEQTEGLDFPDALELLADRYGVELEREGKDSRDDERRRLLALLERAAKYYAAYLWDAAEAAPAREYLAGRGLEEETLRQFRIGYSPSAWDKMLTGAQRSGFRPQELRDTGLVQANRDGQLYDRFRGRIMFPLADRRGRVLGFGARAMGEGRGPKYLNTSENRIYQKGKQLFGIDLARAAATKSGRIVVVEGYTDVLALHQAGIPETVAIMGTALTLEQMAELGKTADLVLLALDADRSGQEAMLRAARSRGEVNVRVVEMPEGKDPADLIAAGEAEAFAARLDHALEMTEFQVKRVLADADLDTPVGRDDARQEAGQLIAEHTQEGSALRDELVRRVADRVGARPEDVVRRGPRPASRAETASPDEPFSPAERLYRAELRFLAQCLAGGELGRSYLSRPSDETFEYTLSSRARRHLVDHFDDPLAGLGEDDPEMGRLVHRLVSNAAALAAPDEGKLRSSVLQLELRHVDRQIARAREAGEYRQNSELAAQQQRLKTELGTVIGQTA